MAAVDNARARAVDRITSRCAAHDEERELRIELVEEIRRVVPFGSYVWAMADPETEVGTSPLAAVPEDVLRELPRLIRHRYLTPINRWSTLGSEAKSLLGATGGRPEESALYREVLSHFGVGDVASIVFRDAYASWGWLDLWRSADQEPFSTGELDHLTAFAPVITAALRRCVARTFDQPAVNPARSGPIVLVLGPDLAVKAQTPDTEEYLRTLLPPDADRRPIPAGAYNVGAQLIAVEAGVDDHLPVCRVRLSHGVWLTFRAARVESDQPRDERDIAVTIEPSTPAERRMLFSLSHGLTPRETQLLELLAEGADTRAVAETLFLSQHTVQDHLKAIFAKTGARNRRTLLSRVAGSAT